MTTLQVQARALGDPTRHEIFRLISTADAPVGIAELTERLGLNHNAIRQHVAKLLTAGLIVESRSGAGRPGRPRLLYEVDSAADSRWGPAGPYERLSVLLAEMVATGTTAVDVGRRAASRHPVREETPAASVEDIVKAMAREGFEPELRQRGARGEIVLRACPFVSTVLAEPEVVCSIHLGLAQGLAERGVGVVIDELLPKDPRKAQCRLRFHCEAPDTSP